MRKTCKLLAVILSAIMILSVVPFGAFTFNTSAATVVSGANNFSYTVLSDGTAKLTKYLDEDTDVVIPTEIDGHTVTIIGYELFLNKNITSVWIPETITEIKDSAFSGCTSLNIIWLPDSLQVLGNSVFSGCTNLSEFHYVKCNLTSVGYDVVKDTAWYNAQPDGIVYLGHAAISAKNLSENHLDIVAGTKVIASRAFSNNSTIKYVYLPDSLRIICSQAFQSLKGIADIYIPDSVTTIGYQAFYYCSNLKSVAIPGGSLTSIGSEAFTGCNLTTAGPIGGEYDFKFGWTDIIPNSAFSYLKWLKSITIPDSVTSIGDWAFSGCSALTSITIPKSVASIGAGAFYECTGLTNITISDSIMSIDKEAFYYCTKLTKVNYTGDIADWCKISFSNYASNPLSYAHNFYINDELVTDLIVPESVTSIGDYAFRGCTGLKSVTIPDSVNSIGSHAFSYCNSLNSVTIGNSVTSIGDYAFCECHSLSEIRITDSVKKIGEYAFDSTNLKNVIIGKGVEDIGKNAFNPFSIENFYVLSSNINRLQGGQHITTTIFGEYLNAKYIKESAKLQNMVIYAIDSNVSSTFVLFADEVGCTCVVFTETDNQACIEEISSSKENYTIPEKILDYSVTSISLGGWYYCRVKNLIVPKTITSMWSSYYIGSSPTIENVFVDEENPNYTSVDGVLYDKNVSTLLGIPRQKKVLNIPASVTSVSNNFDYATELTSITVDADNPIYHSAGNCLIETEIKCLITGCNNSVIPTDGSVETIASYAFYGRKGLTEITIPDSVTSIGAYAFRYCENLTDVYYTGTEQQKNSIAISDYGNDYLLNATWHYNYTSTHKPGDISGDGSLNNGDLVLLFQYLSGWDVTVNESAVDVNGDGKENNQDLVLLFQYLSGWDVEIF